MTVTRVLPVDDLRTLLPDWRIHLRARNLAAGTVKTYLRDGEQLADFLAESGMPTDVTSITREHVEQYLVALQERPSRRGTPISAAYVNKQYRSLQQLFRWLEDDGEITTSPMAKMRPPQVPEKPVPVITEDQVKALFATCKGNTFENRRDAAIFQVLIDTGVRASELSGMEVEGVDFDSGTIAVLGKGRRERAVPFDDQTTDALRRYLRARRGHKHVESPMLWLGSKGPLSANGIQQMIDRRCHDAGVPHVNLHKFRHTYAHNWLAAGGSETGLMRLAGWKSREMLQRYGASEADKRAREEHKRLRKR
jgi:site-specific recombinase XerD